MDYKIKESHVDESLNSRYNLWREDCCFAKNLLYLEALQALYADMRSYDLCSFVAYGDEVLHDDWNKDHIKTRIDSYKNFNDVPNW